MHIATLDLPLILSGNDCYYCKLLYYFGATDSKHIGYTKMHPMVNACIMGTLHYIL